MKRKILFSLLAILVGLSVLEFGLRKFLGLGTPALSIEHPEIHYMFKPDQDVMRFGNRIIINEFGMRSRKWQDISQPRRIIVMGDSVINGGNLTDHDELATTIATSEDTIFGNISAGSWGPRNMIAWINKFGLQEVESVILVLSSHDLTDFPDFNPLNRRTHPTMNPPLATIEALDRYSPQLYAKFFPKSRNKNRSRHLNFQEIFAGRSDLHKILDIFALKNIRACLILHPEQREIEDMNDVRRQHFHDVFERREVPVIDTIEYMRVAIERGIMPFRDNIHLNAEGQRMMVRFLKRCASKATVPAPSPQ